MTQSVTEPGLIAGQSVSATGSGSSAGLAGLKQWGEFQLLQLLGQGGFGEVYRAWDPVLEREIAVKLLLPSGLDAEQEFSSVVSEARALARVRHPNIVPVYGVERRDGRVGFWSDYIRGRTLKSLVETEGPLEGRKVAELGTSMCDALAAVHAAGLLHRDVKASNAMVDENGRVLLMDFGLSQELHRAAAPAGTPKYMAPELWDGGKATVQSDVYAMGVLLHFLATGRYPAAAKNSQQESSSAVILSAPLHEVLQKSMAPNPEDRYSSAARFAEALRGLLPATAKTGVKHRPWSQWVIWGAAVLAVVGAVTAMTPRFRAAVRSGISGTSPAAYNDYLEAEEALLRYDKPGNVERAMSLYQKTVEHSPDFALAYAGLARASWRKYRETSDAKWVEQANAASAKALDLNSSLAEVQMTAGQLHVAQGKVDLGLQELQKALTLDARNGPVHGVLASAYRKQGRIEQAKAEFQNAIDLAPDDWRWPNDLGTIFLDGGLYKQAEDNFKTALSKASDNAIVLYNLGYLYYFEKRFGEAQSAFEQAVKIAPSSQAIMALGSVQQSQGDYPSAAKTYQRAVDLDPTSWKAWSGLADAQEWIEADPALVAKSYEKALQFALLAQKNTPNDPDLLSELGLFYAALHQPAKSVPLLRKAALLAPNVPEVFFHIGSAYERLGQRSMAIQTIARALSLGVSADYVRTSPVLRDLRRDVAAPPQIRESGPAGSK